MEVSKTIFGTASGEIKLDQSTDYVKSGEEHLVFLREGEKGYYYVLSPSSVIQKQNGVYVSDKIGDIGEYTKSEVIDLLLK
ncbi:hypothetical protein GI584_18620 [Gracilibacillus salitolerans]|uniref:Uncharacterized protein n=1 Tax=Gracilibacillus salitolerans TaxID=2663022 RepID=A0A5Q2TQE3_9BACI|nr:hypothetical protein GI584_18620 [Gracilibacillus salitolerans]